MPVALAWLATWCAIVVAWHRVSAPGFARGISVARHRHRRGRHAAVSAPPLAGTASQSRFGPRWPVAAQAGGRIGGRRAKETEGFLQRVKDMLSSDLGLQALQTMLQGLQYNISRDLQMPELVKADLAAIGSKYRRFRGLSRENVQEVKETSGYFVTLLDRIAAEARAGRGEDGLRRIGRSFKKLASKLEVQQTRLAYCVESYVEVQDDITALVARIKSLQEQSDSRQAAVALGAVAAALLGPVAIAMENAAVAGLALAAGSSAAVFAEDLDALDDIYSRFLLKIEQVNAKVQDEQDKLKAVDTGLQDAANEATYLGEDLTDEDFEFIAEAAEEARAAFAKLDGRCDEYLSSTLLNEPSGKLLLLG